MQEKTVASIVTENNQAAPVFEKYHIDFCCKGKRTLEEVCIDKGLSVNDLIEQLNSSNLETDTVNPDSLTAGALINHIVIKHHFYVKQSLPTIQDHLEKVNEKHKQEHPWLKDVLHKFILLKNEMLMHLHKEEAVLFPRIKQLEENRYARQPNRFDASYIQAPVSVMEHEHDDAGTVMQEIRELTNNYSAPDDACTTFKLVLNELKGFEEDLHRHVHLENYVLFPKAAKMLQEASYL